MNTLIRETGGEVRDLTVGALRVIREKRVAVVLFMLVVAAVATLAFPRDGKVDHWLTDGSTESVRRFAQDASMWGNYTTGTLILVAGLWIAGVVFKRPTWRRAAIASLLAASFAGLLISPARAAFGRPRPHTGVQDEFAGPTRRAAYQSFPSGHSGTSFATASALAVAAPAVGIPAVAGAVLVGWSRMYLRMHYLTDVIVGAGIGTLLGLASGMAARGKRPSGPASPAPRAPGSRRLTFSRRPATARHSSGRR